MYYYPDTHRQSILGYVICTGREALSALSGFTDLSSLRRDAALISHLAVYSKRVTIFPDIVFTCSGQITNLKFVGFAQDGNQQQSIQFEVWRTVNNIMMYKRISAVAVNTNLVTEIVCEIFSISPTNMSFEVGDSLGLYVPVLSDLSVFFQNGGSYGNIYQRRSNPTDQLFFNETSTDAKDYPLVEVTTGLFMVNEGM